MTARARARTLWATALVAVLCVAAPARAATRYFLGVGSALGMADEHPLRWARADAERLRAVFVELGATANERAVLLDDPAAADLELELARLRGQVEEAHRQGERTEVIFSYSGHGDVEALHLGATRYPIARLKTLLEQIPADLKLVLIDACRTLPVRSGGARGATLGPAFDVSVVREASPSGMVILQGASRGEVSQESDDIEGAFFTHHLVAALRGAADSDGDARVSLDEAWRYAHAITVAQAHATAGAQHPELDVKLAGEGDVVLADLVRARAVVVLPAALAGDVLLLDARDGRVLLEVRKPAGVQQKLALPARRIRIQVRDGARTRVGEVALEWGGMRVVDDGALTEVPRVLVSTRGGGVDDASPWLFGVRAGPSASAFGMPAARAGAFVERRLLDLPLFLRVSADGGVADTTNARWRFTTLTASVRGGVAGELFLGPVRTSASMEVSAVGLKQDGVRIDADRIKRVVGTSPTQAGTGLGPGLRGEVAAALPVGLPFAPGLAVGGGVGAELSAQAIDGVVGAVPVVDAFLLVGVEL